jgi:hypothetical protein
MFRAAAILALVAAAPWPAVAQPTLTFDGVTYIHRWSRAGQHEFTPAGQEDLQAWTDMITMNVHAAVNDGDALAAMANGILENYERAGRIVRTDSRARTADSPAEHFIAAVMGGPTFLEAALARVVLVDGTGVAIVRSHRIYGEAVGDQMSAWLAENGQRTETALMSWRGAGAALRALTTAD